jgi:hypothetical protein
VLEDPAWLAYPMRIRFVAILLLLCTAPRLHAELPTIRVTSVFPPGARAGTTTQVTVTGDDLDDLKGLRFSHAGLFAAPASDPAGKPRPNQFVVAVAPDVPPGIYDVRAVGRFGVSSPRAFAVGDLPERVEAPGNESPGGATELPVGSVMNGVCSAGALDHFKFTATAGQRLIIDCAARAIDSHVDPVVVLTDAAGRELDRTRTAGVIDFTPPTDGQYLLQVHDATFRGGPQFFYRLSVARRPQVDFVLPPAAQPGTRGKFVLYGRNLPGGTPAEGMTLDGKPLQHLPVEIDLPPAAAGVSGVAPLSGAQASARGYPYRLQTDVGTSNPVFIAFADVAPVQESGDNDNPEKPAALMPPCNVTGQFYPQRDRDWFTLDAKKGDVWRVDVWSHRLGVPSDPFLLVQRVTKNEKGEMKSADAQEVYDSDANAGGADFNTASRDPSYRLEAKEDGTYRLGVRDLFNTTRDDARLTYLLSVRRDKPDFELVAMPLRVGPAATPAPPLLRRGGAVPVHVVALRHDGFNGDIQLSAEGLPPGVGCAGSTIVAGSTSATLVLFAGDNAQGWAGPVRIVGKADVAGTPAVREARGACVVVNPGEPPTEAVRSRLTADFEAAVSASDVAPLAIEPGEARAYERSGAKVTLPLKLAWRSDASGKFKVKVGGHPALDNFTETEIDAKAPTASVEIDLNKHKLPPGVHTLYVRAAGTVKYARNPEATKAADEARAAAEKAASEAVAAAKQAAEKLTAAKAGTDAEATKRAEKTAADADGAAKAAEQKKTEAAARAKDQAPKDTDGVFYSSAVLVTIPPAEKK